MTQVLLKTKRGWLAGKLSYYTFAGIKRAKIETDKGNVLYDGSAAMIDWQRQQGILQDDPGLLSVFNAIEAELAFSSGGDS